jgi:hypothetical protein
VGVIGVSRINDDTVSFFIPMDFSPKSIRLRPKSDRSVVEQSAGPRRSNFDKANQVKELIVTARRFISDFEDRPTIYRQYHRQRFSWKWFEISKLASSLFGEYGFIRLLRLVRLPSKAGCRRGG